MEEIIRLWPVMAFILTTWASGIAVAVGLTMWITGKLTYQDAKRIELKEVLLMEIRDTRHQLGNKVQILHDELDLKVDDLGNRMTRVETVLNGNLRGHS